MKKTQLTISVILLLAIFILGSCKSIKKSKKCDCPTFTETEQIDDKSNA